MAKKYIDTELLRKEIETRGEIAQEFSPTKLKAKERRYFDGKIDAYNDILNFIDSLQQEQPCDMAIDLDVIFSSMKRNEAIKQLEHLNKVYGEQPCDTCTNDKGCVTCKDGELWEGKEQPSEDLKAEEEIEKYMDIRGLIWYDDINLSDFAHHFYELGRQSKESISKDLEEEYKDKDWGILQDMSIGEEDEED